MLNLCLETFQTRSEKAILRHFEDESSVYTTLVHKPEGLTTFCRSIYLLTKSFVYKYLSLASDGQFSRLEVAKGAGCSMLKGIFSILMIASKEH